MGEAGVRGKRTELVLPFMLLVAGMPRRFPPPHLARMLAIR